MTGEPEAPFTVPNLVHFINSGQVDGERPHPPRTERGMRAHTLPALMRAAYVQRGGTQAQGMYALTQAGFEEAERLTGARGLL
jgi:hypothetical protein